MSSDIPVFLYETQAAIDNIGTLADIRICNGQGYNHPTAPGFYEPRILGEDDSGSGLVVQRTVFDSGKLGSGSQTFGTVNPVNSDGALESWLDWGFGRTATLKLGYEDQPYSSFQTVLTAQALQVFAADQTLEIGWASRTTELANPACPATFLGTNSGTAGLEGLPTDIQGTNKPWAMGVLANIKPVQLNSSTRIFGWNFDTAGNRLPSASVDKVRFEGAVWTLYNAAPGSTGGDYATSAALLAALANFSLTEGYYVTCLAESLVAMGGNNTLNGDVTFGVTVQPTASARYAGSLWQACLLRAGAPSADISAADVAALNAAAPYEAGYYCSGTTTFQTIADALAASVAASYVPDRLNVYRIWQMVSPSGTPIASFKRLDLTQVQGLTDGDLITMAPVSAGSDWTPVGTVSVQYAHNDAVLNASSVAGAVSATDLAYLTQEWRTTPPISSSAIIAKYPGATTQTYTTYLAHQADAQAIAAVLLALYGPQRREYTATVTYGSAFADLLELGAIIEVTHPKFGMAAGKLCAIHSITLHANTQEAELKIWL